MYNKGTALGHQWRSNEGRKLLVREREGVISTAYAKRPIPEHSVQPSGDLLSGCLGSCSELGRESTWYNRQEQNKKLALYEADELEILKGNVWNIERDNYELLLPYSSHLCHFIFWEVAENLSKSRTRDKNSCLLVLGVPEALTSLKVWGLPGC